MIERLLANAPSGLEFIDEADADEFNLAEFIYANSGPYHNAPEIVCADGFRMSVQGCDRHYAGLGPDGRPYSVESGFPSYIEEALIPYAEMQGIYNEDYSERIGEEYSGVFGYVPLEIAEAIIRRHNGQPLLMAS